MSRNRIHVLDNGLVLIAEEMPWCESVSFVFMIPSGSVRDPEDRIGLANLTCEMSARGAGDLDNKAFLQTLENLGVESGEGAAQPYTTYSASLVADKFRKTLALYADLIRRPRFPEEDLQIVKQIALQDLQGIEDEPSRKVRNEIRRIFFPHPWGRSVLGTAEGIQAITMDDIREVHQKYFCPNGAILAVAGRIDWDMLKSECERLFGDWDPLPREEIVSEDRKQYVSHLDQDSAQTHFYLASPALPAVHPDYMKAVCSVNALSGGMSSRLFTELREKRGLCYSVSSGYYTRKDSGAVITYCGSRTNRAQESLDVILEEMDKLYAQGINQNELELLKIRSKCSLVMQQESTVNRASSLVRDWYFLKKIRTREEIEEKINALSCESVNEFLAASPVKTYRLASIGPDPLHIDPLRLG
ncbi:MAG: pitrilysin family protein [Planctomycetia bacterium]|nr:pitrilysin family protein [Planctomycetia bacterium]